MSKERQCPYCNHKYSVVQYTIHIFRKFNSPTWECPNCGKEITFDVKRRSLLLMITAIWILANSWVFTSYHFISGISKASEFAIFIPVNLLILILIYSFDIFTEPKNRENNN